MMELLGVKWGDDEGGEGKAGEGKAGAGLGGGSLGPSTCQTIGNRLSR